MKSITEDGKRIFTDILEIQLAFLKSLRKNGVTLESAIVDLEKTLKDIADQESGID